ncbi:chitin binding peritrophin-A domain-containing protein [Phthorimaea operculella]|nr:chitin binding peritrophin-A domain-containing protein [Phthorimaea operculella]
MFAIEGNLISIVPARCCFDFSYFPTNRDTVTTFKMSAVRNWASVIALLASITMASCAQVEDPCKTKSRVVADDKYCDKYWECDNGQAIQYDCPNGLVWAGKHRGVTEGCDYPWRSNYCEYPKVQINPPIGTEHCDWLYGIFGHETSCTRYWTCWNGTATEQLCIGGLLYNENAHSCDWPENVDGCQKHQSISESLLVTSIRAPAYNGRGGTEQLCIGGLLYNENAHSCDWPENVDGCQKHPLCNDDANGNVPLGKSCNRYWQCQGGYPRLQRCPAMLVFDRRSLRCVVPPTEDCEVPTTTAPPPEEEPENRPEPRPRCPAKLVFDRRSLRCVVPPTEDCEVPTTTAPPPEEEPENRPEPRPVSSNTGSASIPASAEMGCDAGVRHKVPALRSASH